MLSTRSPAARGASSPAPTPQEGAAQAGLSGKGRRNLIVLGVACIIVVALVVVGLVAFSSPSSHGTPSTTTSTSYAVDAPSLIASAAAHAPPGYAEGTSKLLKPKEVGLASGGYALFSNQGTSTANMTILVFNSSESAQAYVNSVISNSKTLGGYTDLTPSLSGYQQYGACYGFGQTDPEGAGAVATGVCGKGNVYVMVHVASTSSLPSAQDDMAGLMGAAYQAIG